MNKKLKKRAFVQIVVVLLVAGLYTACYVPFGTSSGAQGRGMDALDTELGIAKTASPADIALQGSGLGNEVTTVTIGVSGYGGTETSVLPLEIVFAIDSSGSMGVPSNPNAGNDPTGLRMQAAKDFVDRLDATRDRAAVVSWDEGIDFTYPGTEPYPNPSVYSIWQQPPPNPALTVTDTLTSDFDVLKDQIDLVDGAGNTNLALGLIQSIRMLTAGKRPEAVGVVIFLTDGLDTSIWPDSISTQIMNNWVTYAKDQGYRIYTIGLGSTVNATVLSGMATPTGGQYYAAATAENLEALYDQIYTEVVSSTAPSAVDVVEVTRDYLVEEGGFSIAPDSVTTDATSGETTITWLNVAQYVGNADDRLASDEAFSVSFTARSSQAGVDLPVDADTAAVNYLDTAGTAQSRPIPQALITVTEKTIVDIDIKPGSVPNAVNAKNDNGVIPVAILTTDLFDARSVDHTSVTFEGARETHVEKKTGVARRHEEDVDGDGDIDLLFHFRHDQTSITSASTAGTLKGMTWDGAPIEGTDEMRMVH